MTMFQNQEPGSTDPDVRNEIRSVTHTEAGTSVRDILSVSGTWPNWAPLSRPWVAMVSTPTGLFTTEQNDVSDTANVLDTISGGIL